MKQGLNTIFTNNIDEKLDLKLHSKLYFGLHFEPCSELNAQLRRETETSGNIKYV